MHCHMDWHLEAGFAVVFVELPAVGATLERGAVAGVAPCAADSRTAEPAVTPATSTTATHRPSARSSMRER